MISLIITSMMAMSLIMAGTYVAFTTLQSSQTVLDVQRNAAQMWQLAALVQANLRPVTGDGVLYPPAPAVDAQGHTGLPAWLAPQTRTPWGTAYGYCVYAAAPQAAVTATAATGPALAVGAPAVGALATVPYPYAGAPGAHDYALAAPALPSALAGRDIVALILAPPVKSETPPRCSDVILDQGQPALAGGGQVVTIGQRATSDLAALSAAARVERFVSPQAVGAGTGTATADAMTLEAALGFWLATRPNTLVLHLAPGRHPLAAALLATLANDGQRPAGRLLVLSGSGDGALVVAANGATASGATAGLGEAADADGVVATGPVFKVPADLRIDGVGFEGLALAALPGTRLELRGRTTIAAPAGVPALRTDQATLVVGGVLTVSSQGDGIQIAGGQALFSDAEVSATVGRGGSALASGLGAVVTVTAVTRRPRLVVAGHGTPLAAIRSGGLLTILNQADIVLADATQFGVILEGAGLEMFGTALGLPTARAAAGGVLDVSGSRVAGDLTTQIWVVPGARCVQGALFATQLPAPVGVAGPAQTQTAASQTAASRTGAGKAAVGAANGNAANDSFFPAVSVSTANRADWTCRS